MFYCIDIQYVMNEYESIWMINNHHVERKPNCWVHKYKNNLLFVGGDESNWGHGEQACMHYLLKN